MRNAPGDREKAAALHSEPLLIATELEMPPLLDRLADFQDEMDSEPAKSPAYPDGLTQREAEV